MTNKFQLFSGVAILPLFSTMFRVINSEHSCKMWFNTYVMITLLTLTLCFIVVVICTFTQA